MAYAQVSCGRAGSKSIFPTVTWSPACRCVSAAAAEPYIASTPIPVTSGTVRIASTKVRAGSSRRGSGSRSPGAAGRSPVRGRNRRPELVFCPDRCR